MSWPAYTEPQQGEELGLEYQDNQVNSEGDNAGRDILSAPLTYLVMSCCGSKIYNRVRSCLLE